MAVTLKNVKRRKKDERGNITRESEIVNPYTPKEAAAKMPQYTLKSTGEKKAGLTDPRDKNRVISPFSDVELQASKLIEQGKQKKAIQEAVLNQAQLETAPLGLPSEQLATADLLEQPVKPSTGPIQPGEKVGAPQGPLGKLLAPNAEVRQETAPPMQVIADVYFWSRNLLKKGNSIDYDLAAEQYSKLNTAISSDISLVSQGLKDSVSVAREIEQAEMANLQIESSAKLWTNKNLRYYKTNGQDILIEAEMNRRNLEDYRAMLDKAAQKAEYASLTGGLI